MSGGRGVAGEGAAEMEMDERRVLILRTDGASRGNPGPAAAGVVIERADGTTVAEGKRTLGALTNNQAEYRALILGLRAAARYAPAAVRVYLDSELVVKQMAGEYRVKDEALRPLYEEASALARALPGVTFTHVPRARNARADALANAALDEAARRTREAREARAQP
jgi:ribonuclease HI